MKSTIVSKFPEYVALAFFEAHLADYLMNHKSYYFTQLEEKSTTTILKYLRESPSSTGFFRDRGLERARNLAKEIAGQHASDRVLMLKVGYKYLSEDEAKGLGKSRHLRASIEQAFLDIYGMSVTPAEVAAEQGERRQRNPDFPYSDADIAEDLRRAKVMTQMAALFAVSGISLAGR